MDEILNDRYTILIASYPVESRVLAELRDDILENLHKGSQLRSDAALILITLFDQMIIRPYHGPLHRPYANIFLEPEDLKFPLPQKFSEMDHERFLELCRRALKEIIAGAKSDDTEGISSHSIIRSIDANWKSLSGMFGWG